MTRLDFLKIIQEDVSDALEAKLPLDDIVLCLAFVRETAALDARKGASAPLLDMGAFMPGGVQ